MKTTQISIPSQTLLLCLFFCGFLQVSFAQNTVNWLQSEFCQTGLKGMAPSRGISFERTTVPEYRLNSASAEEAIGNASSEVEHQRKIKLALRAPLWNSPGLKAVIGFKYENEEIEIEDLNKQEFSLHKNIGSQNMKVFGTNLIVLKPFRTNKYLVLRGSMSYSGAYKRLQDANSNYLNYSLSALMGVRKNADTEYGFGLSYSNSLNVNSLYPVFLYNHNFNENWGIEALLPKRAALRYNLDHKSLALAVMELDGSRYYIPGVELSESRIEDLRMEVSELKLGVSYQRKLFSLLWASADIGYRKNLGFDFNRYFSDNNSDTIVSSDIPGGMYAGITLFITPPKFSKK
jgi:hypothetical protein